MKKIVSVVLTAGLVALFSAISVKADTTNVITNAVGQVVTSVSGSSGVKSITITMPNALTAAVSKYGVQPGYQRDAAATTVETAYTPRDVSDILIGNEGSTGKVWIATGTTSNDWKAVCDP